MKEVSLKIHDGERTVTITLTGEGEVMEQQVKDFREMIDEALKGDVNKHIPEGVTVKIVTE